MRDFLSFLGEKTKKMTSRVRFDHKDGWLPFTKKALTLLFLVGRPTWKWEKVSKRKEFGNERILVQRTEFGNFSDFIEILDFFIETMREMEMRTAYDLASNSPCLNRERHR